MLDGVRAIETQRRGFGQGFTADFLQHRGDSQETFSLAGFREGS